MPATTRVRPMVLAGILILLTSCAVLTIDVDVYKGPLANHEDVQVEQMAAMAIGAKPLLVELRDTLEGKDPNYPKELRVRGAAGFREKANEECWYKPKYIGPAPGETRSRFTNQNADRVNEILSLYEDREDEQYSIFVGRVRQALKDYKTAYEIWGPESMEADEQLWKKVGPEKDSFNDEAKRLIGSKDKENINILAAEIKTLRNNYEEFYTKEGRDAQPLFKSWNTIRDQLSVSQTKDLEALQNDPLLKDKDEELAANANAQFRALAKTSLVDYHAEYLFGLKGKKKDIFVDHVKKISQAFLDARDALEHLWRAEMETIIWLSDQPPEKVLRRDTRIADIAKASLEVIQPRYVAILIEHKDDIKHYVPKETEYLSELLPELTVSGLADKGYKWDDSSYENAKKMLEWAFYSEPAKTANALLASHKFCRLRLKPKDFAEEIHKEAPHLGYISGWKFGLVRAPFDTLNPLDMTRLVEGALPHGAFGKGRLDDGLETLIEKYLRLAEECNPNDEELRWARERLSDALVRFAEKVLFVANNNTLLSPPKEAGLFLGSVDAAVRGIFGDNTRDLFAWKYTWLPRDEVSAYTRVLQAVGNSILVQADALCQQESHQRQLEQHRDRETDVLKYTVSKTDPNFIYPNTEPTAKDVRDLWITLLEYEHDLALRAGNTERAERIKQAIKAAEEKRAGMIYIRPAMAYLRTSFPATSLQDNPNLTWDNMLGGHMMRSIPFGPQLQDFLDPGAKRDARINAEIDKQFWQNINRVRVAGGADTNYVIAKDDIGNWYVKRYSADPNDVIESAKNLARFALSAQVGADMISGLQVPEGKEGTGQESGAAESSLEPVFRTYRKDYEDWIKKDCNRLAAVLTEETIRKRIQKAWTEDEALKYDIEPLRDELTKASAKYLNGARQDLLDPNTAKEEAERGTRIAKAIQKIMQFHNTLVDNVFQRLVDAPAKALENAKRAGGEAEIRAKRAEYDKARFAGRVAQREVSRIVREEVMRIITSRKDAIKDYETAIMVIGQSVGQ